ncbi:MAG: hypothetical protein ABIG71_00080 [Candidatus Uhrbacteria bacterium]
MLEAHRRHDVMPGDTFDELGNVRDLRRSDEVDTADGDALGWEESEYTDDVCGPDGDRFGGEVF